MSEIQNRKKYVALKQRNVSENWKTQLGYYMMMLVPVIWIAISQYIPMAGIYLSFISYKPAKGIFGSEFVGLKYFKEFINSIDFIRVFRNTVGYNFGKLLLVTIFGAMFLALLLYEIKSRRANKIYHTCMLLPSFLSWTVVSATLLTFLNPDIGFLNRLLEFVGMEPISWYTEKGVWPIIILLAMFLKDAGMASVYFYSALLSIDTELFDAANIDGASRLKQIRHISIPAMSKVFCITLITALGGILQSGLEPHYNITFNKGALYDTTLTLAIYQLNGIGSGNYSFTAAVGLLQSLMGLILVLTANTIIKRVDPESAMF